MKDNVAVVRLNSPDSKVRGCVSVCVCVRQREREREGGREGGRVCVSILCRNLCV